MTKKLSDVVVAAVENYYPEYRQNVLNSLPKLTDSRTALRILLGKNPYMLAADDQYISPYLLLKDVLQQRVQPSKETHMGHLFESVLVEVCREYYAERGNQVVIPARIGESVDLEVSSFGDTRGFKLEIKSGINWANSEARKKFLHKMKKKYDPRCDLIEGIVCANEREKIWDCGDGVTVRRLCGADLFERICDDRSIGNVMLETIQALESVEMYKSESGYFSNQIDRHLTKVAEAMLDEYRDGVRGLRLWDGKVMCWSNLLQQNSGNWEPAPGDDDISWPLVA